MSQVNIGVLISGGGTNLQALIDNVENGRINARIRLVISNKKDAYGLERARKHGIKALYIDRRNFASEEDFNDQIIKELKALDIELVVLAGYLKLLSKRFIQSYNMKIINIHPSLIPSFAGKGYYGERVHQAVLDRGVKFTGATVHFVDEGTDTGPIILQEIVRVEEDEDLESIKKKVLEIEHGILIQAVKLYCQGSLEVRDRKVRIRKVQE